MKIALFGKSYVDFQRTYLQLLVDELSRRNTEILVYEPFFNELKDKVHFVKSVQLFNSHKEIKENVDMLFSVGGDGTLLDTVPIVRNSEIPVMGINLGRLGFLSSVSKDEIIDAICCVHKGDYSIDSRSLLQLVEPRKLFGDVNYALNDLTIYRNNSTALVTIHVYVDDVFVNTYWGDGLIVATPTGSTAYSLSVGGPIVAPGSKNFIVSPIASHNLTVRPIVINDSSVIKIRIEGREDKYLMTMDSKHSTINRNDEIIIKKSNFNINLVQMGDKDFYSAIRDKLLWGVDNRNKVT